MSYIIIGLCIGILIGFIFGIVTGVVEIKKSDREAVKHGYIILEGRTFLLSPNIQTKVRVDKK